ncbi:hypothetical protein HN827_06995 [archaeon]|jgi:replication factor A1|nr:hypothetical protein [archaeon]MBT4647461.1 hypothetical protein [archaeon]MBT6822549.1 hypothetical protein [archaeon]MBT7392550.1 hypothetical protein [archaeon]
MKVNELGDKTKVTDITLKIVDKEEPRDVRGGELQVCNFTGEDDTGKVIIALWNDDIGKVSVGSSIKISNGWCSEYNGTLQLSPGKFGSMEVLS